MRNPLQGEQNRKHGVLGRFKIISATCMILLLFTLCLYISPAYSQVQDEMTDNCKEAAQGYITTSKQYTPVFTYLNDAIQNNLTTAAMQQTAADIRSLQTEAAKLRNQFTAYHSRCASDARNVLALQKSSIENFNSKANVVITKAKAAYGSSAPSPSAYQSFNTHLDILNSINQNALSGVNVHMADGYVDFEESADAAPEPAQEMVYTGEPISDDNKLLYKKYLDDLQQEYALQNMNTYNLGSTSSSNNRDTTCVYEKQKKGDLNTMMDAVEQAEEGRMLCGRSFILTAALQLQYETKQKCGAPPSELAEIRKKLEKASAASLEPYCVHKAQTGRLGESDGYGSGFSFMDALNIAVGVMGVAGAIMESTSGSGGGSGKTVYTNPSTGTVDKNPSQKKKYSGGCGGSTNGTCSCWQKCCQWYWGGDGSMGMIKVWCSSK